MCSLTRRPRAARPHRGPRGPPPQVCGDLYDHYQLPTGETVHCFHKSPLTIDPQKVDWVPPELGATASFEGLDEPSLPEVRPPLLSERTRHSVVSTMGSRVR